jgi:hypothetical protein
MGVTIEVQVKCDWCKRVKTLTVPLGTTANTQIGPRGWCKDGPTGHLRACSENCRYELERDFPAFANARHC